MSDYIGLVLPAGVDDLYDRLKDDFSHYGVEAIYDYMEKDALDNTLQVVVNIYDIRSEWMEFNSIEEAKNDFSEPDLEDKTIILTTQGDTVVVNTQFQHKKGSTEYINRRGRECG